MKNTLPGLIEKAFPGIFDPDNSGAKEKRPGLSEDFFFQLAQNARDIIFHARVIPEFKFDYVSPSCLPITGYSQEEFYTDPRLAQKCWHPDDAIDWTHSTSLDYVPSKEPKEIRWIRKDGAVIWIEHLMTFNYDKDGKPVTCQILARDITARKKAEEAYQEQQIFTQSLLEYAPHATVVINADTSIRYVNPTWEKLNGWTLSEVAGIKAPYPWWPKDQAEAFMAAFMESFKQKGGKGELPALKKNGESYWIEINWTAVHKDGKLDYLLINSVDTTERKKAEKALQDSESKFALAFNASPDIMAITRKKDGKFIEVNDSFVRHSGYSREEVIGRNSDEINSWFDKKEDRSKMQEIMNKDGRVYSQEFRFLTKSGEVRNMLFSLEQIMVGDEPCFMSVSTDITERKKTDAALKQSEEKFSRVYNFSPNATCLMTSDYRFIEANESFCGFTGYSKEEIYGRNHVDLALCDDPEDQAYIGKCLHANGKVFNKKINCRTKSGEIRAGLFSADTVEICGEKRVIIVITDNAEQVKANKALQDSEEKFALAFNASPISLSICRTSDNTFLEVNEAFLRDKGYTREEIIGKNARELDLWANTDVRTRGMDKALTQGGAHNVEMSYRTKNGERRTGLVSAEHIKIGNEPCMLVLNNDITQQKQAEEQLRLLSSVTKQVTDCTIITDAEFKITFMNQAGLDMFGYTFNEVKGKDLSFANVVPLTDQEKKELRQATDEGGVYTSIISKYRKDGTIIICDCRLSPMYDENGNIVSHIDVQRDITRQKDVEAKLQEHKKLIDSILATMPEGVLVVDNHDRILLANKALYKILHLNGRLTKNKPLSEVMPLDQYFNIHRALVSSSSEKKTVEFRYNVQDIEKIIYCVIVKMDGERTLVTFSDVTREREEEEKLYLTDRLASIGEMAAGLAHELNNPLTGILTLSQLLTNSDLPKENREDVECIYSEAKRAAGIVKNVLLFARNKPDESGKANTNEVVKDVLRLREYEQRSSNIKVEMELEDGLPEVAVDKGQLQQVFLNMISNAEAAIREANRPGVLTVTTQRVNNHVNIHFSDNGCGIKKQILPRIFDPFFTTKEVGKGTGLGLSICYSIIVKHGGKISVKSQVNEGTTFTIRMPIVG